MVIKRHDYHEHEFEAVVQSKKRTNCLRLMKTALNNVLLFTLFNVVNNIFEPESGLTIPNNIADNIGQYRLHNIVQFCFH